MTDPSAFGRRGHFIGTVVTMSMKHALLVEVPEWDAEGLRPAATASSTSSAVGRSWNARDRPRREGLLSALDRWIGTCGPNDTCLFHFFGHGGMAQFPALGGDLGRRPVFYLATLRPPGSPMVGVLDFEISAALTRLDAICGNVTVRLSGASSLRTAYARPDPDDDAAFVTQGLPPLLRGRTRGAGAPAPAASRGFTWYTLELELDPQPQSVADPSPITLRRPA